MQPQEPTAGLTIRNDVAELVLVTEALDELGERIGFPPKALMQLQVALDEILSNVVRYAWPDGGPHTFCVRLDNRGPELAVVVTDDGLAFDPRAQPPPGPAGGRRPRPGGVGIQMVRQLVDGFDYARVGNLNCVTLVKRSGLHKTNKEEGSDGN